MLRLVARLLNRIRVGVMDAGSEEINKAIGIMLASLHDEWGNAFSIQIQRAHFPYQEYNTECTT